MFCLTYQINAGHGNSYLLFSSRVLFFEFRTKKREGGEFSYPRNVTFNRLGTGTQPSMKSDHACNVLEFITKNNLVFFSDSRGSRGPDVQVL